MPTTAQAPTHGLLSSEDQQQNAGALPPGCGPKADELGGAIRRAWRASQELPPAQENAWARDPAAKELGFPSGDAMGRAKAMRLGLESSDGHLHIDRYRFDGAGFEGVGEAEGIDESSISGDGQLGQLVLEILADQR